MKSSAPHPAEPEPPLARAELRALRSAARSAAAGGGCELCSMWGGALLLSLFLHRKSSAPHPAEPELPLARAQLRAVRSAARSAAASGGWSSAPRGAEIFLFFSCAAEFRAVRTLILKKWYTRTGSNRRPIRCKRTALPLSYSCKGRPESCRHNQRRSSTE